MVDFFPVQHPQHLKYYDFLLRNSSTHPYFIDYYV